jgi:methyl-accepting chemotaxis protein
MIMHPFRPDLDGKDLSGVKDPDGLPLFTELSKCAARKEKDMFPINGSIMMILRV